MIATYLAGVEERAAPRLDAVAAVVARHGQVEAPQVLLLCRGGVGRVGFSWKQWKVILN